MTNAFDPNRKSTIGAELEKTATLRRSMSKWVEKQRQSGKEPCWLALNSDAKPPGAFTITPTKGRKK